MHIATNPKTGDLVRGPRRPAPAPKPKPTLALLTLLIAALVTGGCSSENSKKDTDDDARVIQVKSPDGRTVSCVLWDGHREGGLDCDWPNAR